MTHAFFKALLFLAAGSVIIAMHHEQDMRKMGGLRKYMPITYWTCLIGALALIGFPGFSGFFSKDALIEAVHASHLPGAGYAYWCVLLGVFVTALYTFRMIFMTFHGEERMDHHTREHLHESPLGGDGAAGAAGDPVGRHRLARRSSRCCSAATSAARSRCCRRTTCSAQLGEEFHGPGGVRAARRSPGPPCGWPRRRRRRLVFCT